MANTIQIKRKTTTGAPNISVLSVGELCLVIPDETLYLKKDASTLLSFGGSGSGDMLISTYDPNGASGDAFNMDNMVEGSTNLILTTAERTAITNAVTQTDINTAISALVGSAPAALNTLQELADALADDADFSTTITASLSSKLDSTSTIDGGEIS